MIDVSPLFAWAFDEGTADTQLRVITFDYSGNPQIIFTNANIVAESMTLTQAICDEPDIRFGGCIASSFEIEVSKDVDLSGRYITVYADQTASTTTYPGENTLCSSGTFPTTSEYSETFALFSGDVYSCRREKNGLTRKLIAYDRLYWRGGEDCTKLYNDLFDNNITVTAGMLRSAVLEKIQIIQQQILDALPAGQSYDYTQIVPLPIDNFELHRYDGRLTANDILRQLGELAGVFMRLNGRGNLEYTTAVQTSPVEYSYYIDAAAEQFSKPSFTGIYAVFDDGSTAECDFDDISSDNPYYLEDSIVMAGHTMQSFYTEVHAVRSSLKPSFQTAYTPFELKARAKLWAELGDRVQITIPWYTIDAGNVVTHTDTVTSVILSRRITGIQAMTDEMAASGETGSEE